MVLFTSLILCVYITLLIIKKHDCKMIKHYSNINYLKFDFHPIYLRSAITVLGSVPFSHPFRSALTVLWMELARAKAQWVRMTSFGVSHMENPPPCLVPQAPVASLTLTPTFSHAALLQVYEWFAQLFLVSALWPGDVYVGMKLNL